MCRDMRAKSVCDDDKMAEVALKAIGDSAIPVSIDFIAYHCKIGWGTARALLTNLIMQGKVCGLKTTKGMIYFLPSNEGRAKS